MFVKLKNGRMQNVRYVAYVAAYPVVDDSGVAGVIGVEKIWKLHPNDSNLAEIPLDAEELKNVLEACQKDPQEALAMSQEQLHKKPCKNRRKRP